MPRICPECKGFRRVLADFPCMTCKGAGFVVQNKMPAPCPATCTKGVVKGGLGRNVEATEVSLKSICRH
jgi:DnaJ-class molecular chaperone